MTIQKQLENDPVYTRELDGLRAIWAILILWYHATDAWWLFGWSRVDMFFVLSGYLSTRKLTRVGSRQRSLMTSYLRRALRLLPPYYLLLIGITAFEVRSLDRQQLLRLLSAVTLTQNIPLYWSTAPYSFYPDWLAHTWALAIEVQFSLFWPLLIRFGGRAVVIPVAVWILLDSVILRCYGFHPWILVARGDGFACGAILAIITSAAHRTGLPWTECRLIGAAVLAFLYLASYLGYSSSLPKAFDRLLAWQESLAIMATSIFYAALLGLIIRHTGHPVLAALRTRWLTYVGRLSYGIYLYSFVAVAIAGSLSASSSSKLSARSGFVALALAISAAVATRLLIEQPLASIGQRGNRRLARSAVDAPRDH
jgi:peptidoglycan/LPS O-acetylase OafA/YrhL